MIKNKFAIIIDSICLSMIIFILNYSWINKFIKQNLITFILCGIYSILSLIFFILIFFKKNKIQLKNYREKNNFEKCKKYLIYNDYKSNISFFENITSSKYFNNNIYVNENAYFYINIINSLNCHDFFVANNFYQTNKKVIPLIFICNNISDEFSAILSNSPTKFDVFYLENLYEIMNQKKIYPTGFFIENKKNQKNKLKNIKGKLMKIISNIKFKDTFFSGLSLVIISAFVPFSIYYLTLGTLFLILSFLSIFSKNELINKPINNNKNLSEFCK